MEDARQGGGLGRGRGRRLGRLGVGGRAESRQGRGGAHGGTLRPGSGGWSPGPPQGPLGRVSAGLGGLGQPLPFLGLSFCLWRWAGLGSELSQPLAVCAERGAEARCCRTQAEGCVARRWALQGAGVAL